MEALFNPLALVVCWKEIHLTNDSLISNNMTALKIDFCSNIVKHKSASKHYFSLSSNWPFLGTFLVELKRGRHQSRPDSIVSSLLQNPFLKSHLLRWAKSVIALPIHNSSVYSTNSKLFKYRPKITSRNLTLYSQSRFLTSLRLYFEFQHFNHL